MHNMFDAYAANRVAQLAHEIKASGITAVGLYYFGESRFKQLLTADVARAVSDAGLYIISIFESGFPTKAEYFTVEQANADAHCAYARAIAAGQPGETPIYFTVDYDARVEDLPAIAAYFAEVRRVLALQETLYAVGAYASGLVLSDLWQRGLVSLYTWLTQSTGFSGYHNWLFRAAIVQGATTQLFGVDADLDTTNGAAGGWQPAAPSLT